MSIELVLSWNFQGSCRSCYDMQRLIWLLEGKEKKKEEKEKKQPWEAEFSICVFIILGRWKTRQTEQPPKHQAPSAKAWWSHVRAADASWVHPLRERDCVSVLPHQSPLCSGDGDTGTWLGWVLPGTWVIIYRRIPWIPFWFFLTISKPELYSLDCHF